jgi:hypothetical protein
MKKAIILNDTRRESTHIGCKHVMENLLLLCKKYYLKIDSTYQQLDLKELNDIRSKAVMVDAIIVNGEGTFHDDQAMAVNIVKAVMIAKQTNKDLKVYLINTVWQNNLILDRFTGLFDLIFVRDEYSKKLLELNNVSSMVVPDLIFYGNPNTVADNQLDVVVIDSVINRNAKKLARFAVTHFLPFYRMGTSRLDQQLRDELIQTIGGERVLYGDSVIYNSRMVITGRFHVVCLALMYKVYFQYLPSNTHKIEALIDEIGLNRDIFELNFEKIENLNPKRTYQYTETELILINKFLQAAKYRIDNMFEQIIKHLEANT